MQLVALVGMLNDKPASMILILVMQIIVSYSLISFSG